MKDKQRFMFGVVGPQSGAVVDPNVTPLPPLPAPPPPELDPVHEGRSDTSAVAARKVAPMRGRIVGRLLRMIREAEPIRCGMTVEELTAATKLKVQTVSARIAELHDKKRIAPRLCRVCRGTGLNDSGSACMAEWQATSCHDGVLKRRNPSGVFANVWKVGFVAGDRPPNRRDNDTIPGKTCGPNDRKILRLVRDSGQVGVTCLETERRLRMRHTTASPVFTKCRRNGWILDIGKRRGGAKVYAIAMAGLGELNRPKG